MALVTLTACPVDDENEDDPDEIENGENGNNGGVAGKRIITQLQTSGPSQGFVRVEWSYNDNGSLKRQDLYDESSKLVRYEIWTSNSDGTIAKEEMYDSNNNLLQYMNYSYDANKKPLKAEGAMNTTPWSYDYTFQNGRKTLQLMKIGDTEITLEFNYDGNGRRTTTSETTNYGTQVFTRVFTRTYNSDGTLQKVTFPNGYGDNTIVSYNGIYMGKCKNDFEF